MRNVSDKFVPKIKTRRLCSITFFFFENREIMWKNMVEPDRPQVTIWRMSFAGWIHKAKNTHSAYVVLITFLLHQWLHERASVLRNTYIACLVSVISGGTYING
jgi:hypothetical protein